MHSDILKYTGFFALIFIAPELSIAEKREYISKQMPQEVIEILESDTKLKMAAYSDRMEDPLYPSDLTTVTLKEDEYYKRDLSKDEFENCSESDKTGVRQN